MSVCGLHACITAYRTIFSSHLLLHQCTEHGEAWSARQVHRLTVVQINIEYNISYIYHSLYAFFDRDNIGLPGARILCSAPLLWAGWRRCLLASGAVPPFYWESLMRLGLQLPRGPSTSQACYSAQLHSAYRVCL